MIYNVSLHTGTNAGFEYKYIQRHSNESDLAKYCSKLRESYARDHTKKWSDEKHTEWLTRHYLAVKMMLSATVMLTSYEYAADKNLRVVEPYLLYYSCICSCKALIFTLPDKSWDTHNLHQMTHQKVINISVDALNKISKQFGNTSNNILQTAKAHRELFSYKFPALGIKHLTDNFLDFKETVIFCATVCEIAQMHSECLESSIKRNVAGDYLIVGDVIRACFAYDLFNNEIVDEDDFYRIGYYVRKNKKPCNLLTTATEGMVEDYFDAWRGELHGSDPYNPENNIQIIFPFM